MYAAGTGGLASSGGVIRRLPGASSRCQRCFSHAVTGAMTRLRGESRFTCGMVSGALGGEAAIVINTRHGEPSRPSAAAREARSFGPVANWLQASVVDILGEHETSVATGNLARCSELHGVRPARDQSRRWRQGPGERLTRDSRGPCGDRSIVKDDTQERAVHLEPAVVFDQPELAKLVHEEVHPGARRADHFRERLLGELRE